MPSLSPRLGLGLMVVGSVLLAATCKDWMGKDSDSDEVKRCPVLITLVDSGQPRIQLRRFDIILVENVLSWIVLSWAVAISVQRL